MNSQQQIQYLQKDLQQAENDRDRMKNAWLKIRAKARMGNLSSQDIVNTELEYGVDVVMRHE